MNYSPLSDEELVVFCKENNEEALTLLTSRYSEKAKLIALSFRNVRLETEDLIQEGMIGFLSAVYSFSDERGASFSTYASHCIRNRLLSVIRATLSKKRIPSDMTVSLQDNSDICGNVPSPEENVISQKEAEYISSVISSSLSTQEKNIFMLHLTGMTYDEIAKECSITPKAVDSTLQRARKKLREKLS